MKLEKFSGDIRDRAGPSGQEDGPFDAEVAELWEVAEGDMLGLSVLRVPSGPLVSRLNSYIPDMHLVGGV